MTIIATNAFTGTHDPEANLRAHRDGIDDAVAAGAELVVFPECSLHGYPDSAARGTAGGLRTIWDSAESVLRGRHSSAVIEHAARRGVHVVYGLNEAGGRTGHVYNTAVLTGPDGLVGTYRKVHIGYAERGAWQPGGEWPVFDTPLGRIGLLICADKAWPESTRELALGGAEIMVMPTAWAFTVGGDATIDACWGDYYLMFDRVRAAENSRWFVSSNYVGPLGDTTFGGYSQIVDPFGTVVATSESRTGWVIADIDVAGGIAAAEAAWGGPRLVRDRRPETYRRQAAAPLPTTVAPATQAP